MYKGYGVCFIEIWYFCEENYLSYVTYGWGGVGKDMVYVICFKKLKCVLGLR